MTAPGSRTANLWEDPAFPALKAHVLQMTGLQYYADKDTDLAQRIERRLAKVQEASCGQYLRLLQDEDQGDAELDRLVEELTVGETWFFRHTESFSGLRDRVLPEVLERNRAIKRLRVWSAGCSIGAEAYSVAVLLAQEFHRDIHDWEVSILGTDINRRFLARASKGVFREWDFRGMAPAQIEQCFEQREGHWSIRSEYRRWVSFQYHNLVRHPFPSLINNLLAFDVILCRNVVIYFSHDLIERLIPRFHDALVDYGWLLVGHAEPNIEMFRAFHTINVPGAVLYQKVVCPPRASASEQAPPEPAASASPALMEVPPAAHPGAPRDDSGRNGRKHAETVAADTRPARDELTGLVRRADRGDLHGALHGFTELVMRRPMDPVLHLKIGMIAGQLGDREKAEAALRRALYLEPSNALAHYHYGLVQQKQGLLASAGRSFQNALRSLSERCPEEAISDVEAISVSELRELTLMQLEIVGQA